MRQNFRTLGMSILIVGKFSPVEVKIMQENSPLSYVFDLNSQSLKIFHLDWVLFILWELLSQKKSLELLLTILLNVYFFIFGFKGNVYFRKILPV